MWSKCLKQADATRRLRQCLCAQSMRTITTTYFPGSAERFFSRRQNSSPNLFFSCAEATTAIIEHKDSSSCSPQKLEERVIFTVVSCSPHQPQRNTQAE